MRFFSKLYNFMYGRYGVDELYKFLFIIYILLFILNIFLNTRVLSTISLLIVFIMFYRYFSKNIYQRRKENSYFLKCKNKLLNPYKTLKNRLKDKDHIYKKCRNCKTILKLPLPDKRGIKHSKCPTCKKRLTIFALRKEKIEIIRKTSAS